MDSIHSLGTRDTNLLVKLCSRDATVVESVVFDCFAVVYRHRNEYFYIITSS
jgi:hypothetical protein